MPSTKTTGLAIETIAEGDNNKYLLVNDGLNAIDSALTDVLTLDYTSVSSHTLTESQFIRNQFFVCDNHVAGVDLVVPATVNGNTTSRFIVVRNAGTGVVTVKHTTGDTAEVAVDTASVIYLDGTNAYELSGSGGGGGGASTTPYERRLGDPPNLATMTERNSQANITFDYNAYGELVVFNTGGGTGNNLNIYNVAITNADFDFRVGCRISLATDDFLAAGISVYDTTTNEAIQLNYMHNGVIRLAEWTNLTTFDTAIATQTFTNYSCPNYLRLARVGTTITAYWSLDGENWVTVGTAIVGTDITATNEVGFGMDLTSVSTGRGMMQIFDWSVTQ